MMKKYHVSIVANFMVWRQECLFIFKHNTLLTKIRSISVKFVGKALLEKRDLEITIIFILEKNLTCVNFALLVLLVREHMQCMSEVILVVVASTPKNRHTVIGIPYFLI